MSATIRDLIDGLERVGASPPEIFAAVRAELDREAAEEEASRSAEYAEHVARFADPFAGRAA